ncbi:hypothetical protein [Streptomyces sp. SM11]|uniref:hypothetical protein n=1 Tax=Streptomyces sp. SM11 TaxID=565557 RepID=UPI002155FA62|nr:hypothetical protein [Streptomyces sp. SM11]
MEFFTDFVVTGAVGGADATSTPTEVTGLLGDGFVESLTGPKRLPRCYDLVELAGEGDGGSGNLARSVPHCAGSPGGFAVAGRPRRTARCRS